MRSKTLHQAGEYHRYSVRFVRQILFVARLLRIWMIERAADCSTSYSMASAVEGSQGIEKIKLAARLQKIQHSLQAAMRPVVY